MTIVAVFAIALAACELLHNVREPVMMFLQAVGQ